MFVVAYLYNNNGMASWCWEAAHALYEAHQPVLLVCSNEVKLPGIPIVDVMRFNPTLEEDERRDIFARIGRELKRLKKSSELVYLLHRHLQEQGITPSAYFLNQSDFQDSRISVPQYVSGWAYPTSLPAYLSKIGKLVGRRVFSRQAVRTVLDSIGWWRSDWRAYQSATSILAVSRRLGTELTSQGVKVRVVHPGTAISKEKLCEHDIQPRKLLIVALDLEDSRKRVRWLINALKFDARRNYTLTMVGHVSNAFRHYVCSDDFPATFTGLLPREQVQKLIADHDIFLFGSCLDDWGYVLVEAMSHGLSIVAPNVSPFDEIVGDAGRLYSLSSEKEFREKVFELIHSDLFFLRQAARERANCLFSRQAFGQGLMAAFQETNEL